MRRDEAWARDRFDAVRVARLATVSGDGSPHLVPMVFARAGDHLISVVDDKPKASVSLRRLDNIAANPFVSVLVDEYDDDWTQLWWARADGWGRVAQNVDIGPLLQRYEQYRAVPPTGPVIVIAVDRWSGWSAQ